ncbi:MAG: hypothetical protein ACE5G0_20320 [Rhodothermales bacterium]
MITKTSITPTLLLAALLFLLAGCSGDTFTGADLTQADDAAIVHAEDAATAAKRGDERRVWVFNTQLRPLPGENPSQARGHLQIKLRKLGAGPPDDQVGVAPPDDTYTVEWKGKIFNPAGETFTGGGIFQAVPPDPIRPVFSLPFDPSREGIIITGGRDVLPAAQAEALIASPENFVALFTTVANPAGALGGRFIIVVDA